jgi:hypothetical protein
MFCSGCGHALAQGQAVCPQCGRPIAPVVPAVPGFQFQLESYAGKVRALSLAWFVWAALSMVLGLAGLTFAQAFFSHHFGNWGRGPWGDGGMPDWFGPAILRMVWLGLTIRIGLALVAAWGLYERTQWGRIVAIVAAFLSLLKFPFGTALGIWTLVVLLGYQNTTLYEQLNWDPQTGTNR